VAPEVHVAIYGFLATLIACSGYGKGIGYTGTTIQIVSYELLPNSLVKHLRNIPTAFGRKTPWKDLKTRTGAILQARTSHRGERLARSLLGEA